MMIPSKLKHDAIIEVVFEIRFSNEELPEIIIGRLADRPEWKSFEKALLPLSEIPASVRRADPSLRFEPVLQLQDSKNGRLIRIGTNAISYHLSNAYPGWTSFKKELVSLVQWFYPVVDPSSIDRLGLRYIDALRADLHSIDGLSSLNLTIAIGSSAIDKKVMLNFSEQVTDNHIITTRVTSRDLIVGQLPKDVTVVTDIDVYTPDGAKQLREQELIDWLNEAHSQSKSAFFALIPSEKLEELAEE